jgi:hypothetical protein
MCRIWLAGVPAGRQPSPTDCRTAERNVPTNGRVIYGRDLRELRGDERRRDAAGEHSGDDGDRGARKSDKGGRKTPRRGDRGDTTEGVRCVDRDRNGRCDSSGQP